jgi:DNA sulfur modification protein DndD
MSNDDLKIRSVTLKNFRTFYGEKQPIELSIDPKKPVTVIHGKNGKGKTSLINSIHWCIYGTEKSDDKQKTDSLSEGLVHTYAIDSLNINQEDEMFVRIDLVDQNDELISEITRTITFKKISHATTESWNNIVMAKIPDSIEASTSSMYRWKNEDSGEMMSTVSDNEIAERLEMIFPKVLSSYVLFDAELLREFHANNADALIKKGIESITGLPLIKEAIKYLSRENRKITEKNVSQKSVYKGLNDRIKNYESRLESEQEKIKVNTDKINECNSKLKPIREFLIKHDDDAIKQQEIDIKRYEEDERRCITGISDSKNRLKSIIFENLTNYELRESHAITSQKFKVWEDAGLMPSHFSKEALQSLLDSENCVCERPLKEKDEQYRKNISAKADNAPDTAAGKELGKIRNRVEELESEVNEESSLNFIEQIKKLRTNLAGYRNELKTCKTEIKIRKEEFDDKLNDTVTTKLQERTQLEKEVSKLQNENGRGQTLVDGIQPKLNIAKKEEIEMKKGEIKDQLIQNQVVLADYAENILNISSEELFKKFKNEVTDETQKYFLDIAPQADEFSGIEIDDSSFEITAVRSKNRGKKISQGQAHALGLSYISGIRTVMQRNYFMMIDSPFHNISQDSKLLACRQIPERLGSTQITFFTTDTEYRGSVESDEMGDKVDSVRNELKNNGLLGIEYNLVDLSIGEISGEKYRDTNIREIPK